jgi:hypothetical protein
MPLLSLLAIFAILVLLANFDWEIYVLGFGAVLLSCSAYVIKQRFLR